METQKKEFLAGLGFNEDRIAAVETAMAERKVKGVNEGRRTKAVNNKLVTTEVVAQETVEVPVETPDVASAPVAAEPVAEFGLKEMTEAFVSVTKELAADVKSVKAELAALQGTFAVLQDTTVSKARQIIDETPTLSYKELVNLAIHGSPEAQVDGRSVSGPVENKDAKGTVPSFTGIPFLDKTIQSNLVN